MLNKIKIKNESGFTIVELLIVIVVIAILAAITIVAYNGISNRAKTTSGQSAAANVQKKVEAFNGATGAYPTATTHAALTTALNGQTESSLGGIALSGTLSSTNGTNTVSVENCTAGATGYRYAWFDFATNNTTAVANRLTTLFTGSTCTTWASLT